LIATDVVLGFPDRVARRPERYAMPKDKNIAEVKAELQARTCARTGHASVLVSAQ
jgi:hypothetical protein